MNGRRRHPRFAVATSGAVFSVLSEVAVRQRSTGELVVLDRERRQIGEVVTLDAQIDGKPMSTRVRVVGSRPQVRGGSVFHEVVARVEESGLGYQDISAIDAFDDSAHLRERLATLTSHVAVHVINCSAEGCLFEVATTVSVGTVGGIRVSLGGREVNDALQVVRCTQRQGPAPAHQVGARFLSTTPPYPGTLRYSMRCDLGELGGWLELTVPKSENVLRFRPVGKSIFRNH